MLEELLEERAASSRGRRNPRGVKRKMSNWPLRRPRDKPAARERIKYQVQVLK